MNLPFLVPLREILRTYLIVYLFVDLFGTYSVYSVAYLYQINVIALLETSGFMSGA